MSNPRAVLFVAVSSDEQAKSDKTSIPQQLDRTRAAAGSLNATIIDELVVDGFSRSHYSVELLQEAMRAVGMDVVDRLKAHWHKQDFDWLIVDDSTRLSRKSSLMNQIMGQTIDAGARVWLVEGGEVNDQNVTLVGGIMGIAAETEIKQRVKKTKVAKVERLRRGLPASLVPISHRLVRDEMGNATHIEVDEDMRQLFNDWADIFLRGEAVNKIELELEARGHQSPKGKAWLPLWRVVCTPVFWGHVALRWLKHKTCMAIIEPGHPIPDGMLIEYNRHEPMFTGELAERVKAEIRRRRSTIRGRTRPYSSYKFSGLVICEHCGYHMVVMHHRRGMTCQTRYQPQRERSCPGHNSIHQRLLIEQASDLLQAALDHHREDLRTEPNAIEDQTLEHLTTALEQIEADMTTLVRRMASASDAAADVYQAEVDRLALRRETLRGQIATAQGQHVQAVQMAAQRTLAFNDLREHSVAWLWQQDDIVINQLLTRILGAARFVVSEKRITGIMNV